ncbi:MAG: hypothetical protein ACOC0U_02425 [Desulfovibrionales bacterium]
MEEKPMTRSYKGYTIKITPYEDRCSRFAVTVIDPDGREFKHQRQAGQTGERAFAYGERIVDWELGYEEQKRTRSGVAGRS